MAESTTAARGLYLPREHGAWVMLACAAFTGCAIATPLRPVPTVLALVLILAVFVGQESLRQWERARCSGPATLPAAIVALAIAIALSTVALAWLAPSPTLWAALAAGVSLFGLQRWLAPRGRADVALQLVAVAGFALALPLVAAGGVDRPLAVWVGFGVTIAFYAAAVCSVRMLLTAPRRLRTGGRYLAESTVRNATAATALAVALPLSGGAALPWRQPLLALALVPALLRLIAGWHWLATPPTLKRVGLWETAWTLWFTLGLTAWLRS